MLLTGKYDHSIDAKNRLAIPAEIRGRLDPEKQGATLYLIMGPNGAIWVWPEREFEEMAGELEPSLMPGSELMDFDEITFPEAYRVELDSAGRIRVPEDLKEEAGLSSKVVILGMRNHLEVRDPADWEQRRKEKAARRAEIVQSARKAREERRARESGT